MGANAWQVISIVGYSLAGILFIAAVVMFIKMNVLAIINDLTGRTAAKQIQQIREQNALTGNKRHRPNAFNIDRRNLSEPMGGRSGRSGRLLGKTGQAPSYEFGGMGKTAQALAHESKRLGKTAVGGTVQSLTYEPEQNGKTAVGSTVQSLTYESQQLDSKGHTKETSPSIVMESLPTKVLNGQQFAGQETEVLFENSVATSLESVPETKVLSNEEAWGLGSSSATEVLPGEVDYSPTTEVLSSNLGQLAETAVLIDSTPTEELEVDHRQSSATVLLSGEAEFFPSNQVLSAEPSHSMATEVLTDGVDFSPATELPAAGGEGFSVLSGEVTLSPATEVLDPGTEVLSPDNETTVLYATSELVNEETEKVEFKIVKDVKVVHTKEVI